MPKSKPYNRDDAPEVGIIVVGKVGGVPLWRWTMAAGIDELSTLVNELFTLSLTVFLVDGAYR